MHLGVEEEIAGVPQAFGERGEGDLRGIGAPVKHRLGGERRSDGDAVDAPNQLATAGFPDFEAVGPAELVKLRIAGDDVRRDPRAFFAVSSTRAHGLGEGPVDRDAKRVLAQRAPQAARPIERVERQKRTRIGRKPTDDLGLFFPAR